MLVVQNIFIYVAALVFSIDSDRSLFKKSIRTMESLLAHDIKHRGNMDKLADSALDVSEPKFVLARDLPPDEMATFCEKYKEKGWAPLKMEYIIARHLNEPTETSIEKSEPEDPKSDDGQPPHKRAKLKGRNKNRPGPTRPIANSNLPILCSHIISSPEASCPFGPTCRFSHDLKSYLSARPPDLAAECPSFLSKGRCQMGITCRFGASHINEEGHNIIDTERWSKDKEAKNKVGTKLQVNLRKRAYDFDKSYSILSNLGIHISDSQRCRNRAKKSTPQAASKGNDAANVEETLVSSTDTAIISGNSIETPAVDLELVEKNPGLQAEEMSDPELDIEIKNEDMNDIKEQAPDPSTSAQDVKTEEASAQNSVSSNMNGENTSESIDHGGDDSQVKLRHQEKKRINFANLSYLAPLTTVGNLPFRRVCKELGADITCGEMAMASNLLKGKKSEWALLTRHPSENVFGVQVCGSYPDMMTKCAQLISETCDIDFIDINCGCPIDLVYKRGEGSGLMRNQRRLESCVKSMSTVLDCPLTVKMRAGIYKEKNVAHTMLPRLRECGAAMATVHGRTREQRYTRSADWEYIRECVEAAKPMPLFGNGDVLSWEDAVRCQELSGSAGIMVGRGALIKPWIFTEIHERRHWDISASERFDMLRRFSNYGLEHWGSDDRGVEITRRFMLEWLSFLHRYIPVGLLERLPQRINEKPPQFIGRSDLETLLSSTNCQDWVKISEMLLGPVPSNFQFLPKHKANSYQA